MSKFLRFHGLALVVLVVFTSVLLSTTAQAAEVVVFVTDSQWDSDLDSEIHVMRPDGSDHRIIATRYPVSSASIDSKGNWIAYTSPRRKEIRIVSTDGSEEKLLVKSPRANRFNGLFKVSWSPNGRYVAYGRDFRRGYFGFEVYDVVRKKIRFKKPVSLRKQPWYSDIKLTGTLESLLWSPNSRYLAFTSHHENPGTYVGNRRRLAVFDVKARRFRYKKQDRIPNFPKTLGFLSNTTLLRTYGGASIFNFLSKQSADLPLLRQPFKFIREVRLAISPDGRHYIEDDIGMSSDYQLSGTPRLKGSARNLARISIASARGEYVTPLDDYSSFYRQPRISLTSQPDRLKSIEWKNVRSGKIFNTPTCWGWVVTLRGTNRPDNLVGTRYVDVIAGGGGDDVIQAGGGRDIVCGGEGNDRISGDADRDLLLGDAKIDDENSVDVQAVGNDTLSGGPGLDYLYGHRGRDVMDGGPDDDFLDGGDDDDVIDGGTGFDDIKGGGGTDSCSNYAFEEECE